MKLTLAIVLLGLLILPLRGEDWTTTDGKTYRNVQVVSHNAAYVTILDEDGGARIKLSKLGPDLQKRFGYDPAKAPAIIAATKAADQQDKEAVAQEKDRTRAERAADELRMKAISDAMAAEVVAPLPPGAPTLLASTDTNAAPGGDTSVPPSDVVSAAPPIASEPPTEIDDFDYGDLGAYGYGYGAYGYGYGGSYGGRAGYGGHSGYSRSSGAGTRTYGSGANAFYTPTQGFSHR